MKQHQFHLSIKTHGLLVVSFQTEELYIRKVNVRCSSIVVKLDIFSNLGSMLLTTDQVANVSSVLLFRLCRSCFWPPVRHNKGESEICDEVHCTTLGYCMIGPNGATFND